MCIRDSYKTWGYPFVPLIYLLITAVTVIFVVIDSPQAAAGGLGLIVLGLLIWALSEHFDGNRRPRDN